MTRLFNDSNIIDERMTNKKLKINNKFSKASHKVLSKFV